jgi:hypothetical protein
LAAATKHRKKKQNKKIATGVKTSSYREKAENTLNGVFCFFYSPIRIFFFETAISSTGNCKEET